MTFRKIKVFFATNRNRLADTDPAMFGETFRDGNERRYVTGSIDLYETSPGKPDTAWSPDVNSLQLDPPKEAAERGLAAAARAENDLVAFARNRSAAANVAAAGRDFGLILLPGFASTFVDALRRAAQVADEYRSHEIFCFSWP